MDNFWTLFLFVWFLGVCLFGLLWYKSYLGIAKNDYRDVIEPELKKFNFKFISSDYFKMKFSDKPIKAPEMKQSIAYGGGGLGMVVTYGHRSPRKVKFQDNSGETYEAIALVELKGVISKKFEKIYWDPPLENFNVPSGI